MWNKVKSLTNIRGNLLFDNLDNNKKKIFMKNNAQNTNFISRTSESATRLLIFIYIPKIHLYTLALNFRKFFTTTNNRVPNRPLRILRNFTHCRKD